MHILNPLGADLTEQKHTHKIFITISANLHLYAFASSVVSDSCDFFNPR